MTTLVPTPSVPKAIPWPLPISITFARPGLFALNPLYEVAIPLVIILTMRFILDTFNRAFEEFLIGAEKVDQSSKSTFKNYAQSRLFVIPTVRLIQNVVYMALLIVVIIFLNSSHSEFELLTYWATVIRFRPLSLILFS